MKTRRVSAATKIQSSYRVLLAKRRFNSHLLLNYKSPELLDCLLESYDSDADDFDRCPPGVCSCIGCINCGL